MAEGVSEVSNVMTILSQKCSLNPLNHSRKWTAHPKVSRAEHWITVWAGAKEWFVWIARSELQIEMCLQLERLESSLMHLYVVVFEIRMMGYWLCKPHKQKTKQKLSVIWEWDAWITMKMSQMYQSLECCKKELQMFDTSWGWGKPEFPASSSSSNVHITLKLKAHPITVGSSLNLLPILLLVLLTWLWSLNTANRQTK